MWIDVGSFLVDFKYSLLHDPLNRSTFSRPPCVVSLKEATFGVQGEKPFRYFSVALGSGHPASKNMKQES